MKSDFIQPRFEGERFTQHTLPVEVVRDLAAYEELVRELARHIYRVENPDRQRVPRGFDAGFELHLEKIDGGSATPVLSAVMPGGNAAASLPYFQKARDVIVKCVGANGGPLPTEFPPHLLSYFNYIGRSLRNGERMALSPAVNGHAAVVLTPDRRRTLVLAAGKEYKRELELTGVITEIDAEKSAFRLRTDDGKSVPIAMNDSFKEEAREAWGRQRRIITVKGIGTFDSYDKLLSFKPIGSADVQFDAELSSIFETLTALQDGWLDGRGKAPNKTRLSHVATRMIDFYPTELVLPLIVPTAEGNLLFEWASVNGDPSVDIDLQNLTAWFHAFKPDGSDLEETFSVDTIVDWVNFGKFLFNHVPEADKTAK